MTGKHTQLNFIRYQAPGDCGKFLKEDATGSKINTTIKSIDDTSCIERQSSTTEKGGKRKNMNKPKKSGEPLSKKNKLS